MRPNIPCVDRGHLFHHANNNNNTTVATKNDFLNLVVDCFYYYIILHNQINLSIHLSIYGHPNKMRAFIFLLLTCLTIQCLLIGISQQLECYVCQNQEDNKSKCTETVKICELEQEQCLTEVRWGSKPFWSLVGQKQHFVSKRCATKGECQESTADKEHKCDRIWYNDWNCTTCCSGDKCNYYVTLAATSIGKSSSPIMILASCILAISFIGYKR